MIVLDSEHDLRGSVVPTLDVKEARRAVFAACSEIDDFDLVVFVIGEQNVLGLHIAMDYTFVSHELQALAYLLCDYFELKPSYDDFHQIVVHSEEDMEKVKEQLIKVKTLEDDTFQVLESVMLESSIKREKFGQQEKSYTRCYSAELRTLVTPSGCYVCPYFRGSEEKMIGDARELSFKEIWKNTRKKIIKNLNPSVDCKNLHCIRHKTNLEIDKIISSSSDNLKDVTLDDKDLFI